MTIINSISLFSFGLVMRFLPALAPAFVCPANPAIAKFSAGGLWLLIMGTLTAGIGAIYVLKISLRQAARATAGWRRRMAIRHAMRATAIAARTRTQPRAPRMIEPAIIRTMMF